MEEEVVAHGAEGGLTFHPLDQFMLRPLFGGAEEGTLYNPSFFSITNATLWMALAVLAIFLLFVLGTAKRSVVPGRAQSMAELAYGFIHKMVEDVAGHDGVRYFPYIFTLFLFILFVNYLGLIPLSFAPTSHIAVTAIMGFGVFLAVTILGFVKNGVGFLGLFWMKDSPAFLRPIIAVIELISYFVRPVSHSIRLGGNIMAGHAVMQVFASFAPLLLISAFGILVTPLSILAITAIYGLEILVAGIQAYVFTILTCVYLKDALHPGH